MYADFMGRAGDEIFNQLAKWQAMSAGQLTMPVVLRISVGSKYGAQHSQDWTALVHHIPGLKVVYPGHALRRQGHDERRPGRHRPRDLLRKPEGLRLRRDVRRGRRARGYYEIDLGEPSVKRRGKDLTIITLGPALYTAVAAADELAAQLRHLRRSHRPARGQPAQLRAAGRIGAQDRQGAAGVDAVERGSVMQTVAANLTQLCFDDLDGPPVVVGSRNWITPAAELETLFFPQPAWLIDAIHERHSSA